MSKISVIIPAFNEERTLPSIVEIVRSWGKAAEIVVVDDGSTDQTFDSIKQFVPDITILRHKINKGKADAMISGIQRTTGEIILFLDGDIIGLTKKDLDDLLAPVLNDGCDMVLGVSRFWGVGKVEPFNSLTGQRVVLRKNIVPLLPVMSHIGYGVELLLNNHHEKLKVTSIKQEHVFILGKLEKQALPDAMQSYIKEASDLMIQTLRNQVGGRLTPTTIRVFRSVQGYLSKALEFIQQ